MFSANAVEDFDKAYREGHFFRIIGTNAVHHEELLKKEWYIEADVTTLFAQIISLLHHNRSLSPMLDNRELIAKKIKRTMAAHARPAAARFAVGTELPGSGTELPGSGTELPEWGQGMPADFQPVWPWVTAMMWIWPFHWSWAWARCWWMGFRMCA
jgi:hypothetical protein